ncbi:hypothetical protein GWK08_18850 [Leptobacterium flavescens]|uniref:DinB family protein n=1 Tax=Leptobacterium flavescens TaxID=472055 RepID=A0A6P0UQA1_9FLAO|nr:hypothetical protein [Leptobacterium flavescens]NER15521.1 hypothetical protein [Leptobacterium flavescens]
MLKQATYQNLDYLRNALGQLSDEQFSRPLEVLSQSTLGMHVRHILEFYTCLINAVDKKEVDYDSRVRDTSLEVSTDNCLNEINRISGFLEDVDGDVEMKLKVNYALNPDEDCETMTINTSLYRELQYNIEHAVHHLAIIKIGIKALEDSFNLDDNFGIAASTIRNKNVCAQ